MKIIYFDMAFTVDRNEAADRLGVSTRTVDRYIQANRIRTRRIGKKLFLEEIDIDAIKAEWMDHLESGYIVVWENDSDKAEILPYQKNQEISQEAKLALAEFSRIYADAQGLIAKKDEEIKDLSYKLWKAETELKNSVNASEYRRTTYLLETVKAQNELSERQFSEKISLLEKDVQKKNSFIIGIMILFVLAIIASLVFFIFHRL